MDGHDQDSEQTQRIQRYSSFVLAALQQRPIRGRWSQLPALIVQSLIHGKGISVAWRAFRAYRKDERGWRSFLGRAIPVMTYPLMVNQALRHSGVAPSAGLVLISFDEARPSDMAEIVHKIENNDAPSESDRQFLTGLLADESYHPNRRRKLPSSITRGRTIYACDLWIPPLLLNDNRLDIPFVPCMAEPGDTGRINVLPWWIAVGEEEPALNAEFWMPGQIGIVASS